MEEFNLLLNIAKDTLQKEEVVSESQVIAFQTGQGNIHCMVGTQQSGGMSENGIVSLLQENEDTIIVSLVCMWKDGTLDVPHIDIRKKLCNLNSKNVDAKIMLYNNNGKCIRTLGSCI